MIKEVKVTRNYQITIPLEIREKLGIKVGDKVLVVCEGDEIKIIPKKKSIKSLKGIIKKDIGITSTEIDKVIRTSVEEVGEAIEGEYKK